MQLGQSQVDQTVVQVVAQRLGQQTAEQRRDRLLPEPWRHRVAYQALDVLVAHLAERDRSDLRHLVDHPLRMGRFGEPLPQLP